MSIRFEALQIGDLIRMPCSKRWWKILTLFPETERIEIISDGYSPSKIEAQWVREIRR